MSNLFEQANGWLITSWTPDASPSGLEGIPTNAFQVQMPLTVLPMPDDSGLCAVIWQDKGDEWCSASGLAFDAETLTLQGNTLVNFGGQSTAFCLLQLTLITTSTPMTINGFISVIIQGDAPEVGSGTFTATANPNPPVIDESRVAEKGVREALTAK